MDCDVIQPDLVPYHFGVIDDATRTRVEQHLTTCPRCLKDYLALKREIETGELRPSPMAKERLRDAVAKEVARKPSFVWSWWERPLAVAFAGATVFAAMFAVHVIESSAAPPHESMTHGAEAP